MGSAPKEKEELRDYRVERFADLRFTQEESQMLANATTFIDLQDKKGVKQTAMIPLHPSRVKKMLDQGCTHKQAIRIFAPLGD